MLSAEEIVALLAKQINEVTTMLESLDPERVKTSQKMNRFAFGLFSGRLALVEIWETATGQHWEERNE